MRFTVIAAIAATLFCAAASADVPFQFQSGQPARASEVNQNFTAVDREARSATHAITISYRNAVDEGVTSATCPTSYVPVGVGCRCDDDDGRRNIGMLLGCDIINQSGIAGCLLEFSTFDASKGNPLAELTLTCMQATDADLDVTHSTQGAATKSRTEETAESYAERLRETLLQQQSTLSAK